MSKPVYLTTPFVIYCMTNRPIVVCHLLDDKGGAA